MGHQLDEWISAEKFLERKGLKLKHVSSRVSLTKHEIINFLNQYAEEAYLKKKLDAEE